MDLSKALAGSGALRQPTRIKTADRYAFDGGLNLMDPPSEVKPGQLLGCLNYEPGVRGGYRRMDGYERFDGHPSPSDTPFTAITTTTAYVPAAGVVVTESGSGATGAVAYVDVPNRVLVLTNVTGRFVGQGSTLTSSLGTALTFGSASINTGATTALTSTYYLQKFLYLQTAIGPVGGAASSGAVLGVCEYNSTVYAFRNNAAGTAADMWQATSTGWTKISLGIKVYFNKGVYANSLQPPAEGSVLIGTVSGAGFTLKRVVIQTGTWGTDAAGYFIVDSISGTPTAGETLKLGSVNCLNYLSSGAQVLPAGGFYRFRIHNFNAAQNPSSGYRMYGVNGVGRAFEYDVVGGTFVNIETGMSPDTPDHLEVHADYLFFSFPGGSLQNSGYQLPLVWNAVYGASSRAVGESVTFLREDVSQTLVIGTRRRVWTLTGISLEAFQIRVYSANTGAVANTDENTGQIIFMEDRGFTTVSASAQYGDFEAASLSDLILNLIPGLIYGDTPIGAITTRKKNMYRVMFASGQVLMTGVNAQGKFGGWTTGIVPNPPSCVAGGYTQKIGTPMIERCFMGCANGYVYELDKGRSFDGANLQHFLRLAYNASRSPDTFKRYRRIQVDLTPEGTLSMFMSVDYDYGNRSGQVNQPLSYNGNGGFWDVALWDQFNWDGAQYAQALMKVEGEGYNIGLFFAGNSNNDASLTIYGASLQWSPRVINRNTGSQ